MAHLLAPIPYVPVYVRDEFLHDLQSGHGNFTFGYAFAFCAVPARVPSFQVILETGAQWARLPIHALCMKEKAEALPLSELVWWDCFEYTFEVLRLPMLESMRCKLRSTTGKEYTGTYLMTVDWHGEGFSHIPDQHKNHHIIALESGQLAAYPNNKIIWDDPSFVTGFGEKKPDYKVNTHVWSVEAGVRRNLTDTTAYDYGGTPPPSV
jgi:hypothetical protein